MKYFVFYETEEYERIGGSEVFDTEDQMLRFLDKFAGNPHFTFQIIRGIEVKVEPQEVATRYRVAKG